MNHPNLQSFMKSNEKFDICFMESFNADAFVVSFAGFSQKLENCQTHYLTLISLAAGHRRACRMHIDNIRNIRLCNMER